MNIKLTLSINDSVVKAAKKYASANKTSISQLLENYIIDLIYSDSKKYPSQIQELIGMAELHDIPKDYKMEKLAYLENKYLKG